MKLVSAFFYFFLLIYGIGVFIAPEKFLFFIKGDSKAKSKVLYRIIGLLLAILAYLTLSNFWFRLLHPPQPLPL